MPPLKKRGRATRDHVVYTSDANDPLPRIPSSEGYAVRRGACLTPASYPLHTPALRATPLKRGRAARDHVVYTSDANDPLPRVPSSEGYAVRRGVCLTPSPLQFWNLNPQFEKNILCCLNRISPHLTIQYTNHTYAYCIHLSVAFQIVQMIFLAEMTASVNFDNDM